MERPTDIKFKYEKEESRNMARLDSHASIGKSRRRCLEGRKRVSIVLDKVTLLDL